jgi:hypothetical protein
MELIPSRFLLRLAYPCRYIGGVPHEKGDDLLDLPESCRIDNFAALDDRRNFADLRLGWNESGLAVQIEVRGKSEEPQGDAARPRASDGVTLWLDTRGDRSGHRATRHCHQFHLLPTGGGTEHDEPTFLAAKINRALHDAPLPAVANVPFQCQRLAGGYRLECFLPATVLNGFDPDQQPRLGIFWAVRDAELGDQTLGVGADFPYGEDPSLWASLELVR